jgi:RNA polymerase sigma factor (sigma-70 family)
VPEQKAGLAPRQSAVDPEAPEPSAHAEFGAFYKESYRRLVAITRAFGATAAEAEDAVQDAMKDLMTKWSRVRDPFAYATTAALRFVIKTRERDRKLQTRLAATIGRDVVDGTSRTETVVMWEDVERLKVFLKAMPPEERKVFALVYDELSPSEIAILLGKSPVAVRQNLFGARKRAWSVLEDLAALDRQAAEGLPDLSVQTTSSAKETR